MKRFFYIVGFGMLVVFLGAMGWWLLPRPMPPPKVEFVRYEMTEDGLRAIFRLRNTSAVSFSFEGRHASDPCYEYRSYETSESVQKWEGWNCLGFTPKLDPGCDAYFPVRPLDDGDFRVGLTIGETEFSSHSYGMRHAQSFRSRISSWLRQKLNLTLPPKLVVWSNLAPPPPTDPNHPDLVLNSKRRDFDWWSSVNHESLRIMAWMEATRVGTSGLGDTPDQR